MNKVVLMGHLTRDPEMRYSQSAEPVAFTKMGIAINRRFKRPGEPDVDFFDCIVFGKNAEFADRYMKKGLLVTIVGRLQNSSWDDKETGKKRWKTEIVVEELEFAESKASFEARQNSRSFSEPDNQYTHQPATPATEYSAEPTQNNAAEPTQNNDQHSAQPNPPSNDIPSIPSEVEEDDLPF